MHILLGARSIMADLSCQAIPIYGRLPGVKGEYRDSDLSTGKRYYLRLLLTTIRGPTLFKYLRTVDSVEYGSFREAYITLGLLHDDQHWFSAFTEAIIASPGRRLRYLFVTALL